MQPGIKIQGGRSRAMSNERIETTTITTPFHLSALWAWRRRRIVTAPLVCAVEPAGTNQRGGNHPSEKLRRAGLTVGLFSARGRLAWPTGSV